MSVCAICGKDIPEEDVHLVYAFVGPGIIDTTAYELCLKHTDSFIEFSKGVKE